ncbi:MAG: SRPBCC family protein [Wenzhouxiangella sp.]
MPSLDTAKRFKTILVRRTISAPIDAVFALLSDHAGYTAFKGIKDARLLKAGSDHPNGLGAVRRIGLGAVWFEEAITAFDPPQRMDYKILRSRPPIEHQRGSIQLRETAQGTEVTWTSTFRIRIPLIGRWMTGPAARAGEKAFDGVLRAIGRRLGC